MERLRFVDFDRRDSPEEALAMSASSARPAYERAKVWLREQLAEGPVQSKVLKKAADRDGIAWSTIRLIRDEVGMQAGYTPEDRARWYYWLKSGNKVSPTRNTRHRFNTRKKVQNHGASMRRRRIAREQREREQRGE